MPNPLYRRAFDLGRRHSTPLFVFYPTRVAEALSRFHTFTRQLPLPAEIFYSYKTNYLPALCEWMRDAGVGAEVTSPIEWDLATQLNTIDRIVVNGIGKCAEGFLRRVVNDTSQSPRLVNLETDTEIGIVCHRMVTATPLQVGLRVTLPGFPGEHGSDPSERWSVGSEKFGWRSDGDAVIHAAIRLASAAPAVKLVGLHVHFGAQIVSASRYESALGQICALLKRLRSVGVAVNVLDFGGGIASGLVGKRRSGPLAALLKSIGVRLPLKTQKDPDLDGIAKVFQRYQHKLAGLGVSNLVFEPGRFLAEPSMVAVSQVIAVRRDGDRVHAVLDMGTNVLKCWRSNETRTVEFDYVSDGAVERFELVGPLCHRSDTFGTFTLPGALHVGSLVCFDAVGAYTLGDWIANTWRRPAVVSEDGETLWNAQESADLLRPGLHRIGDRHVR